MRQFRKYAGAFFHGAVVEVLQQGLVLNNLNKKTKDRVVSVPTNFLEECKIPWRQTYDGFY